MVKHTYDKQPLFKLASILLLSTILIGVSYSISDLPRQMSISRDTPMDLYCGHLTPNAVVSYDIAIINDTNSAIFYINWTRNESLLNMSLFDPDGRVADLKSEYDKHERGNTYEYYLLQTPKKGTWIAEIIAGDLLDQGDDYCLRVTLIENKTVSFQEVKKNVTSIESIPTAE
jgi:hypothetical protein